MNEIEVQNHVADYYVNKRYKGLGLKYHFKVITEMMEGIYGKILDVGCGTGIIHDLYPEYDITGIDISEGMLRHHQGEHYLASADNIPFPDRFFDCVVCRSVLHHLPDPKKALSEMVRVLKPGGRFVCWETNKSWLATFIRRMTQHGDHFSSYHCAFSDLGSLIREYFGSDSVQVKHQGFLAYPLLGFPDIIDFSFLVRPASDILLSMDHFLSDVPLIKKLSFAVMIKARKSKNENPVHPSSNP